MVVALVVAVVRSMPFATCLRLGVVMETARCPRLAVDMDARPTVVVSMPLDAVVVVLTRVASVFAVSVRIVSGSGGSSRSF